MSDISDEPLDSLWREYGLVFRDFDDLTLARWMCQTLGQLQGRVWRLSHPLVGAYRLAAQVAHDRQNWFKRLATTPPAYRESECCRAPTLPLLTRDVQENGLICQHCGDTCAAFEALPDDLQRELQDWAQQYAPLHAVAHWDDAQRKRCGNYDAKFEDAARRVEKLLGLAGSRLAPRFLEQFPAVIWEDQDECLEVRPEDVKL
jgi:hypothetical protein